MVDLGRALCRDLDVARRREWLVTNGRGGFGMGTVAGVLTRRYHGLLVAALKLPLGRTLLLAKLDETVFYDDGEYELFVNHWTNDVIEPQGHQYIERFYLDGTTPVWHYALGDALLEKRLWLLPGENVVYVRYTLLRSSGGAVTLEAKGFFNYRDYHSTTIVNEWQPAVAELDDGLKITMFDGATPVYFRAPGAEIYPQFDWYEDYLLAEEEYRGQDDVVEDHLYLAFVRARLAVGESVTISAGTIAAPPDGDAAWQARLDYEAGLPGADDEDGMARRLALAADQFIVAREAPEEADGRSVIAGYPWFGDWGRDTMIALPGLTLATGRPSVAATILRTYAHFVDQGMLPNRFPDAGEAPEYNTIDASLWYFEAVRAYHAATGDDDLVRRLYPTLADIIAWHRRGTRYNIHMAGDGLIYGGDEGVQLTWMDAKVGDWVVTPRIGKPVEINALWYNALRCMVDFAALAGESGAAYEALADRVVVGFERFWYDAGGYCYDVLDGPDGDDTALRPNQLLAVSLPHSPLTPGRQRAVVDRCARQLLTSYGVRSLAPGEEGYSGHYGGNPRQRDGAYHQGTAWAWLLGPFVAAHLRVYGDKGTARSFLAPLVHHLEDHGLGSISEICDGDAPFVPRGCPAQAWSVAEILRVWRLTAA